MLEIALQPGLPEGPFARLRPLCGQDEVLLDGDDRFAVTELLDRLLVATPGTSVGPGRAAELALCDRDRILAELYRELYGDEVEARAACAHCAESFDLAFSLTALLADREEAPREIEGPEAGPVLDVELPAVCPHCGGDQTVRFRIDHFLLRALADERPLLSREVHLLAGAYGWSLEEILTLSRGDRHALVRLVLQNRRGEA